MSSTEEAKTNNNWDLTSSISPYLDRHMLFPLLEYLEERAGTLGYDPKEVATARLTLLEPTNMVDYAISSSGSTPELEAKKTKIYEELTALQKECAPLDDLCKNETERTKLAAASKWTIGGICHAYPSIRADMVPAYLKLAKYNYECGDYEGASERLSHYISFFASPPPPPPPPQEDEDGFVVDQPHSSSKNDNKDDIGNQSIFYLKTVSLDMLSVLWGKLAADVMRQEWEAAIVAVDAVKVAIESLVSSHQMTALEGLQQRSWLLHWSLFCYWNVPASGLEQMVDLFHSDRYKQAITTNAPHLVRYLTAAVLLCKRRKQQSKSNNSSDRRLMKNLINVMQDCEYSDPIVEFVHCICVKFDFDGAQQTLLECESVLQNDFFLCKQTSLFMEEARVFVFEHYCRIHNKMELKTLGETLAMNPVEAEKWMVDLIRNASDNLDAKIHDGCVVMGSSGTQSIYEQVLERTKDLNMRSATLVQNFSTMMADARKEKAKQLAKAMRAMEDE